jgi:hypothetical protein
VLGVLFDSGRSQIALPLSASALVRLRGAGAASERAEQRLEPPTERGETVLDCGRPGVEHSPLEQAGLVERRRGEVDRRSVQVELTRSGHALHGRLLKAVIDFNQRLHRGLSPEDAATLRRLLAQLHENVGR